LPSSLPEPRSPGATSGQALVRLPQPLPLAVRPWHRPRHRAGVDRPTARRSPAAPGHRRGGVHPPTAPGRPVARTPGHRPPGPAGQQGRPVGRGLRDRAPKVWRWPLQLGLVTSGVLVLASVPGLLGVERATQPVTPRCSPATTPSPSPVSSPWCGWASSPSASGA